MHELNSAEADRLMTVCNSCRTARTVPVFPAMEMRRSFSTATSLPRQSLPLLRACYTDCQSLRRPMNSTSNVPQTLAVARHDSYAAYAWRAHSRHVCAQRTRHQPDRRVERRRFILGSVIFNDRQILSWRPHGPRAFYK